MMSKGLIATCLAIAVLRCGAVEIDPFCTPNPETYDCPFPIYTADQCPQLPITPCNSSLPCQYPKICCDLGCGLNCTAQDVLQCCPPRMFVRPDCSGDDRIEDCDADEMCSGGTKCCPNGCARKCVANLCNLKPVGKCCPAPKFPDKMSCPKIELKDQCSSDLYCKQGRKCCSNGCGTRCLDPVNCTSTPCCPNPTFDSNCPADELMDKCKNDSNCSSGQKCCTNGCGLRCQYSECNLETVDGCCPAPEFANKSSCPANETFDQCKDDLSCNKGSKCCSNGCGNRCVPPKVCPPKPCCPAATYESKSQCPTAELVNKCTNDSSCKTFEKCCTNGCGLRCVNTTCNKVADADNCCGVPKYTNKSSCPAGELVEQCKNDLSCERGLKCCSSGCALQCSQAVLCTAKECCPKLAFPFKSQCPAAELVDKCKNDSACKTAGQKCCSNGCGLRCVNSTCNLKPVGDCCASPAYQNKSSCPQSELFDQCKDDLNCTAGLQCCSNGCGTRCAASYQCPTKQCCLPATYPSKSKCPAAELVDKCKNDTSCKAWEKCCTNGCGLRCLNSTCNLAPVAGCCGQFDNSDFYPDKASCPSSKLFDKCKDDLGCDKGSMCCSNGCGTRCVQPTNCTNGPCCPKPTFASRSNCSTSDLMGTCRNDASCPSGQRCCSNGCALRCVGTACNLTPVDKQCATPRYPNKAFCPKTELLDQCSSDLNCTKGLKCCTNGCGLRCSEPISSPPKAGCCPVVTTQYTSLECVKLNLTRIPCKEDVNCTLTWKCCDNGCNALGCTAPTTPRLGLCPKNMPPTPCNNATCTCDSDCFDPKQKCCTNNCKGTMCVNPA